MDTCIQIQLQSSLNDLFLGSYCCTSASAPTAWSILFWACLGYDYSEYLHFWLGLSVLFNTFFLLAHTQSTHDFQSEPHTSEAKYLTQAFSLGFVVRIFMCNPIVLQRKLLTKQSFIPTRWFNFGIVTHNLHDLSYAVSSWFQWHSRLLENRILLDRFDRASLIAFTHVAHYTYACLVFFLCTFLSIQPQTLTWKPLIRLRLTSM